MTLAFAVFGALALLRPATATLRTDPWNANNGRTIPCGAPAWHSYPSSSVMDGGTFGAQPGEPGYEELRSGLCSWEVNRARDRAMVLLGLSLVAAVATVSFHVAPRRRRAGEPVPRQEGARRTAGLGATAAVVSVYGWWAAYQPAGGGGTGDGGILLGLLFAILTTWSWVASGREDKRRWTSLAALATAIAVVGYLALMTAGMVPPPHHRSD